MYKNQNGALSWAGELTVTFLYMQKLIINCLDLDLYGDGVDCEDEYVEILDGDTVDALSLGKWVRYNII